MINLNRGRKKLCEVPLPSLGAVLWVAAILRLGSIPLVHSFRNPIDWEFGPLAKNLAAGLGYSELLENGLRVPSVYMPPAYGYFMAFFYRLGGDRLWTYLSIELVQAFLGVLLVYTVYRLAILLFGPRAAITAACLIAIYPTQIYMCNEFHGISIYILLQTAAVLFLIRYLQTTHSMRDVIAAGLCMGLLMLFRGEAPALVFLYAAILLYLGGRKALLPTITFLLVAYACLAPWVIRNYVTFHKIILVCASSGENLWIGNNPRATGSQHYKFFDPMPQDVKTLFDHIQPSRYAQLQKDDALKHLALVYIRTHPWREIKLALTKLWIFWVFDPSHDKGRNPIYWVPSVTLTCFATWGAWSRRKRLLGNDLFLISSVLFATLVGMVVFVLPRYKIVVDPFIMIFAANVIAARKSTALESRSGDSYRYSLVEHI